MRMRIKAMYLAFRHVILRFLSLFTGFLMQTEIPGNITRVLVVAHKRIGDAVVSIPVFRAIKQTFPDAVLTVLTNDYTNDIYERVRFVDNLIVYPRGSSLLSMLKAVHSSMYREFDLAIDLTCDYTLEAVFLLYLCNAKYRVGYNIAGRGFLFHKPVEYAGLKVAMIEELLALVRSIGIDTHDTSLELSVSEEEMMRVEELLNSNRVVSQDLLVAVHPGGYYKTQRWGPERFAYVADELIKKHNAAVVLICGPGETALISAVSSKMVQKPIELADIPLAILIALLKRCDLLICNNSGPLHIAVAVNTLSVSTIGPTVSWKWAPSGQDHIVLKKDVPCIGCDSGICAFKSHECMQLIGVQDMMNAVEIQISRIKDRRKDTDFNVRDMRSSWKE